MCQLVYLSDNVTIYGRTVRHLAVPSQNPLQSARMLLQRATIAKDYIRTLAADVPLATSCSWNAIVCCLKNGGECNNVFADGASFAARTDKDGQTDRLAIHLQDIRNFAA